MSLKTAEVAMSRPEFGHTKVGVVGVVGVGAVGAATSLALIERGVCRELVLIDKNIARARGVALDMVAAFSDRYDTTLSLISVVGAGGVVKMYEPPMSDKERRALEASAEALRKARSRILPGV